ncbi:MAG: hypothetical protein SFV22_17585 [Saprospiraceae bacterium]|nr:hypothetical protein [Saprospiraceae bacterium]
MKSVITFSTSSKSILSDNITGLDLIGARTANTGTMEGITGLDLIGACITGLDLIGA